MGFFSNKSSNTSRTAYASNTGGDGGGKKPRRETPKEIAARQMAGKQKDLQALDDGALYIMLFLRSGQPNNFHWGLYHHYNADQGGYKFHIQGDPGHPETWYTDHGMTHGAMSSVRLIGMVRIGKNLGDRKSQVANTIMARDDALPTIPNITCRVYVEFACRALKEAGLIIFSSWTELQAEVMGFGNAQNSMVLDAVNRQEHVKPRPVLKSRNVN